jgi:hypothetical protein
MAFAPIVVLSHSLGMTRNYPLIGTQSFRLECFSAEAGTVHRAEQGIGVDGLGLLGELFDDGDDLALGTIAPSQIKRYRCGFMEVFRICVAGAGCRYSNRSGWV